MNVKKFIIALVLIALFLGQALNFLSAGAPIIAIGYLIAFCIGFWRFVLRDPPKIVEMELPERKIAGEYEIDA